MKISIITATYNSEKTIQKSVLSVANQLYHNFEHIIVDNQSTDSTLDIIREVYQLKQKTDKLKIISEPDKGISDAFNKGILAATGDIIAILNGDDYYTNELVLQKAYEALKNKEILFAHGNIYFHDDVYGSNIRKPLLCPIYEAMPYNHPAMFIKKDLFNTYGLFDLYFKTAMDYELILRYEKLIPDFRKLGVYIQGEPIAVMEAGGESWNNEKKGLNEIKYALKKHNLWTLNARLSYFNRLSRYYLKGILFKLNLNIIINLWRKNKWGN